MTDTLTCCPHCGDFLTDIDPETQCYECQEDGAWELGETRYFKGWVLSFLEGNIDSIGRPVFKV